MRIYLYPMFCYLQVLLFSLYLVLSNCSFLITQYAYAVFSEANKITINRHENLCRVFVCDSRGRSIPCTFTKTVFAAFDQQYLPLTNDSASFFLL